MNQYITNRTLSRVEAHPVPGAPPTMFWVGFPLADGWSIQALVSANDAKEAEQIARASICSRWPQWKGVI